MYRNDYINKEERDSLQQLPLEIDFTPDSHREGLATYFRAYLLEFMRKWVQENPKPDGEKYNIFRDGLRIYTTLDARLQALGEAAVNEHMANLQEEFFLQNTPQANPTAPFLDLREGEIDTLLKRTAMRSERWRALRASGKQEDSIWASFKEPTPMTVFSWKRRSRYRYDSAGFYPLLQTFFTGLYDVYGPHNRACKSLGGGFNYKHFQYDQVKQGRRQIGSTFKPFLYATAIDQLKLSPCEVLPDALFCIEPMKHGNVEAWCPKTQETLMAVCVPLKMLWQTR